MATSGKPDGTEQRGSFDEADIGSGEITPGEQDTQEDIKSIPPLPHDTERGAAAEKPAKSSLRS